MISRFNAERSSIERLGACTSGLTQYRVRLDVSELEIGMHVDEIDRPWLESPFLFQGFFIESEQDLRDVRRECKYVYVTITKQVSAKGGIGAKRGAKARTLNWS